MKYYDREVSVFRRIGYFVEELVDVVWGLRWVIISVAAIIVYGLAN